MSVFLFVVCLTTVFFIHMAKKACLTTETQLSNSRRVILDAAAVMTKRFGRPKNCQALKKRTVETQASQPQAGGAFAAGLATASL